MADLGAHLSQRGTLVDTNNDGIVDGFAHTVKNTGNFTTFSLTNGVLSLQPAAGGSSIGGADTQVQFNDGGSLNGESTFVYNKTTNTLSVSNLTVSDTLTVTTTTTLNSNTVTIGDAIIVLNSDATGSASANAGIEIERGDDTNVQLLWDETNDQWDFDGFALGAVGKVYGSGSGAIYTFTSDTDTGVEHTGTDQLGLLVGNTRVLMVNANGVNIAPAGASGAGSNQALLVDDIVIDTQTITTSGSNKNLILAPHGSGSIELGGVSSNATEVTTTASAHNVVGTSVTISSGSTTARTTNNIAGGSLTLAAGQGKGTGAGGSILFKTADGGSSGSSLNSLTTKMTILDSGFVGIAQNTPTVPLHVGGDAIISGNLTVSGTSTTVSTTNTFVTDSVLTLNSGETADGVTGGVGGFEVDRGANSGVDNPLARFVFDESDDKWKVQLETGSGSGSYNAADLVAKNVEGTTGTFSGDLTVDTNTLKVDSANNRVGIGTASPSVLLDVNGEIAGSNAASFQGLVTGHGFLASLLSSYRVGFINNNASNTAIGMPLRVDGSHGTSVVQANQAQSNSIANCAVGLAIASTANGATGAMAVAGSVSSIAAAQFIGTDPSDGDAVYVSGTAGKLTVDVPTSGFVQQIGRIQDTNVIIGDNSGTATIIVSIGTPIAADVYDDDDTGGIPASIQDADGDTKIQVEESSDEDKIRFDTGGAQRMIIDSNGVGINESSPDSLLHLTDSGAASPTIKIENTGTNAGEPEIIFQRTGAGAQSQDIGHIKWKAKDDGGNTHNYGSVFVDAEDETGGTEDGRFIFMVAHGGSDNTEIMRLSGGEGVVFNDSSNAMNFRVESNGDASMLFVDGTNNRVGIGTDSPTASLHVAEGETLLATTLLTVTHSSGVLNLDRGDHGGRYVLFNVASGTVNLPTTSTAGDHFTILNITGGNITLGRNTNNINGAASDKTIGTFNGVTCIAIGSNNWIALGV